MKFKSDIEVQAGLKDSSGAIGTNGQLLSSTGSGVSWFSTSGFVPYVGATGNVNLGAYALLSSDLIVNHASGSGVAASITKGGAGEALTVVKTSGSGNAASITGGTTLISELNLTTDLADAYIASAAIWNAKQNALNGTGFVKVTGTTVSYDNNTYALDSVVVKLTGGQTIAGLKTFTNGIVSNVTTAIGGLDVSNSGGRGVSITNTSGALFGLLINNDNTTTINPLVIQKQGAAVLTVSDAGNINATSFIRQGGTSSQFLMADGSVSTLTNPITGTGTTNYVPKWTSSSAIGNSTLNDTGNGFGSDSIGSVTLATANWYKLGVINDRGGGIIVLSTAGGNYGPVTYEIKYFKNWTNDAALQLEKYGNTNYISQVRIKQDPTDSLYYLEILSTAAVSMEVYHYKILGYNSTATIYTGTLTASAATGTVARIVSFTDSISGMSIAGGLQVNLAATFSSSVTAGGAVNLESNESYLNLFSTYSVGMNARARIRAVGAGGGSGYGGDFRVSTRGTNNVWNEDAFIVNSSGNVGIGTTSPDNGKLTILKNTSNSTESSYGIAIQSNTSNAYTELLLGADDTVDCGVIQTAGKNTSFFTKKLSLQPNGGNVLIGTITDAGFKLDVNTTNEYLISWNRTSNSNRWAIGADSGGTYFSNRTASTLPIYIANGGNVGIGGTNPSGLWSGSNRTLEITSGTNLSAELRLSKPGASITNFLSGTTSTFGVYTTDALNYEIYTSNVARMRITSDGKVGIGTISPSEKLHVNGKGYFVPSYQPAVISGSGAPYYGTNITLASDLGSNQGANRMWSRYDASGRAAMTFETNTSSQSYSSDPQLLSYTEYMRISGNGNVLIGTTTDAGFKLDVNGTGRFSSTVTAPTLGINASPNSVYPITIGCTSGANGLKIIGRSDNLGYIEFFNSNGTTVNSSINGSTSGLQITGAATFSSSVTATGFFNSSDIRLKDLVDYDYNVESIKPITYLWKDSEDKRKKVGYSAQEVQKVLPDAVNEGSDGMLSVDYIQVLVAKIEMLEEKLRRNGLE